MVFVLSALWWMRIRGLCRLSNGRDWLWGKLGLALVSKFLLSKSLVQFSAGGWGYVASLYFGLRPTLVKDFCQHAAPPRTPVACAPTLRPAPIGSHHHWRPKAHRQAWLSLRGSPLLCPGFWCAQGFVCALQESLFPRARGSSVIKSH